MLKGCIYAYPKLSLNTHEVELINSFGKADTKKIAEDIIDQRAQNSATTVVDFSLYRDGITELSYQGINPECAYDFVLEAYSFLKDLVHSHKFHQHDDDAIIVPYPVINDTDTKWIEKTIRNLHKSIVSIYRNTNYQADLINAIGRLSYLESFQ